MRPWFDVFQNSHLQCIILINITHDPSHHQQRQSLEDLQNVQSSFSSWHPDSKTGKCPNRLPWYAAKQDHAGPVEASRTLSLNFKVFSSWQWNLVVQERDSGLTEMRR